MNFQQSIPVGLGTRVSFCSVTSFQQAFACVLCPRTARRGSSWRIASLQAARLTVAWSGCCCSEGGLRSARWTREGLDFSASPSLLQLAAERRSGFECQFLCRCSASSRTTAASPGPRPGSALPRAASPLAPLLLDPPLVALAVDAVTSVGYWGLLAPAARLNSRSRLGQALTDLAKQL